MLFFCLGLSALYGQTKLSDGSQQISPLTREYVYPTRIVWTNGHIVRGENLLVPGNGQANLTNDNIVILKNNDTEQSGILLDFGKERNGALELVTGMWGGGNGAKMYVSALVNLLVRPCPILERKALQMIMP